MMKTLSLGIPTALAALSAVSNTGTQVKSALAPEDLSWCSSSLAEYATLAGVAIPDRRWMAWSTER
jgi:hypothetical protein